MMDGNVRAVLRCIEERGAGMSEWEYREFLELIEYEIEKTLEGDMTEE